LIDEFQLNDVDILQLWWKTPLTIAIGDQMFLGMQDFDFAQI